jgi:hypothetical protein
MMRTAVELSANVAGMSSIVLCELSASCTRPLAILNTTPSSQSTAASSLDCDGSAPYEVLVFTTAAVAALAAALRHMTNLDLQSKEQMNALYDSIGSLRR